jgi:hypothetical protein
LKSSFAKTAGIEYFPRFLGRHQIFQRHEKFHIFNAAATHRNQALTNTPRHFGQSLMMTTGAGSGCCDDYHQ